MADNTTLNTGSGGDVIATDDVTTLNGGASSGVKVQRVKVMVGADGTATDVSSSSPLPISINAGQSVSLGDSTGKAVIGKTGSLATTATTADQVIVTYTVTAGKTFYLEGFNVTARLTTYATTATNYGTASLENPSGTKLNTAMIANAGVINPPYYQTYSEPIPIAAGTVIRVVCTPGAVTSYTWQANLWGYEK